MVYAFRVKLNYLNENKFRYNFKDTANPVYSWGTNIKTSTHYRSGYEPYFTQNFCMELL